MLSNPEWSRPSPWHAGEVHLQHHAGVAERMGAVGPRVIRDHLIDQHRGFYPLLPFAVFGAVDAAGDVWATLRANTPGFLQAPDHTHLDVELARDQADPADPGMEDASAIALLGIDLATRRRNRVNGTLHRHGPVRFTIAVEQAYGNCPQYIQGRDYRFVRPPRTPSPDAPVALTALTGPARALLQSADTFFVASAITDDTGHRQVDVSHRGGRPGFVRIDADGGLTIPDFAGNFFFNTLGNLLTNPKAGLVFVDFDQGDLLQMTGDTEVILDSPEIAAFQGAQRLWRFHPRRLVWRPGALPLRWAFRGNWSPQTLLTGDWRRAGLTGAATPGATGPFRTDYPAP